MSHKKMYHVTHEEWVMSHIRTGTTHRDVPHVMARRVIDAKRSTLAVIVTARTSPANFQPLRVAVCCSVSQCVTV